MTNPLLERNELPPFRAILPNHVVPAVDQLLTANRQEITKLLEDNVCDWDGLIAVIEALNDFLSQSFGPVSHMNSVVNTPELRDAYNASLPKLSEYQTEMGQNADLFSAYQSILTGPDFDTLDQAQKKSIENAIRDFRLSGIDLPKKKQSRFAEISKRLSELSSQFSDNVLDATMGWKKVVTDKSELSGLPENALGLARQMAEQNDEKGYLLTLDIPSYLPVLSYCENEKLRREMYEAFVTRASDQGPGKGQWDNSEIIHEILTLRKERAELLGFRNFAELSLATKMAQDTDQVIGFLTELAEKSKPAAEKEFAAICEFAQNEFDVKEINAWDVNFYAEKLKEHRFSISEEKLRPYFPEPTVLSGLFEVVRRLYDIEIEETKNIETWHEDVTTYNITKDGITIARFYLDLYARANKRGGAWMDDCRVRRITAKGETQLPVAYLTCNFSAPVGGNPSLLTHTEVVTLFHEFGHGMHHMMTKVTCAPVSGVNGVAWDAVELPSQFMENWCWQKEALAFISAHFKTGESLPAEMLEKLLAAKNFQSAMMTVRQLEFALFDFRLHLEFDPNLDDQVQTILNEVRNDVAVVPAPEFSRFQHGFSHIFGGGYAAGYYSYKWAEVLSADAFAKFQEEGIFNRQTGEKFLTSILEVGGSVDPMDMFVEFRGREPEIDALLKQDGILE
ncbi:MAG: oligopeptidase A [Pseudomonadales bacterium]|jgi:oligopeptidase A|nr:oligopeptidase A [Pseudomonadales bacterium]MDP6315051.1 oligopeptidase A [Pseudomonadales bacterium]MDP7315937.1 oligopeptidase A [Pseudomonadales bacterium]|tara:strand:+ start:2156 stop:4192 length:2037 start_codon:yes stop_codon:yes gene_type:complete